MPSSLDEPVNSEGESAEENNLKKTETSTAKAARTSAKTQSLKQKRAKEAACQTAHETPEEPASARHIAEEPASARRGLPWLINRLVIGVPWLGLVRT